MVVPAATRLALAEHARAEEPNEACGLVVLRDGVAERYEPGRNEAASPYRFEILMPDPEIWYLPDEDAHVQLGLFHSHISSPPRPSRTDVEYAQEFWPGLPYLIYTIRSDELAAWTIAGDGRIEPLALADGARPT